MSVKGRQAIVTGGTSGIGLAIAEALARAGADVVINASRGLPRNHELAERLSAEHGVQVRFIPADLSDGEACRRLVGEVGRCEILVNNAGIQHVAPVEEFAPEKWERIIAVNLSSAFHTTAAALPLMREAGWGRIINISSVHGLSASPFKAAYVAAKHGMVGLTKVVALETAEEDITCNAICPAYVLTPLVENQIPEQMAAHGMDRETVIREVMLARQPSRKFVTVEQVAGTALFLCSPAAEQITGVALPIDGGWMTL